MVADFGKRVRRAQGAHAGLNLERILDVAGGLDPNRLTMRGLAAALGVDHKALNHHVRDRDTLLSLLAWREFSRHFEGTNLTASDWKATARVYARASSDSAVSAGPFASRLRPVGIIGTAFMRQVERFVEQLLDVGFTDTEALRLIVGLTNIALGHARDVVDSQSSHEHRRRDFVRTVLTDADSDEFPSMSRLLDEGIDTYGQEQLEFDIEVFISGASALLAVSRRSELADD